MTRKRRNKQKKSLKKLDFNKMKAKSCKSKKYVSIYGRSMSRSFLF